MSDIKGTWLFLLAVDGYPVECSACSKQGANRSLRQHVLDEHPFPMTCAICTSTFPSDIAFCLHYLSTHADETLLQKAFRYANLPKDPVFDCPDCSKSFPALSSYLAHRRVHLPPKVFICEFCPFTTSKLGPLNKHRKEKHAPAESLACQECNKSFSTLSSLKQHQRNIHGPDANCKALTCDTCGKTFNNERYLEMHVKRVHQAEKRFFCRECGKGFFEKVQMQKHE